MQASAIAMWEKILLAVGLTIAMGVFTNYSRPAPKTLTSELLPRTQIVYKVKNILRD